MGITITVIEMDAPPARAKPETDATPLIMQRKKTEYEVQGMNISHFLDKDLLQKLKDDLGEIGMVHLSIMIVDKINFIAFTHKTYANFQNNLMTISIDDEESTPILMKILGLKEE